MARVYFLLTGFIWVISHLLKMTDDLTHLKRRDSHSIREMYLPHSPKKWKGQNGPWKISFFRVEKSSYISVFLQSSWFKLFYGSPGISDIVTYCLVGCRWMKIQNKVTVLNVWVQTNSKKTCPTVSLRIYQRIYQRVKLLQWHKT